MVVLVTCKNYEDPFKNESTRLLTTFLPLLVYEDFFQTSRAANSVHPGHMLPYFKSIQAFITDLVTCKNEYDSIKNEGARVLTTLYIHF